MNGVFGYTILTGASCILDIKEMKGRRRRYLLERPVAMEVTTDTGILTVRTEPGFVFDGRSGPSCIDWYAPNLGSLDERMAWLMHDALGYGQSLGFNDTNRILRYFLRDICGYRKSKAWLIEQAVGLDSSWYGPPQEGDWCRMNIGKVFTCWEKR